MIEPGPAERGHKEIVAQHVILGDVPELQRFSGIAVMPHDQAAGIAPCGELVIAARVDLHLVLIKTMHEIARNHAVGQRLSLSVDEMKRSVRHAINLFLRNHVAPAVHFLRLRHEAAPDFRQDRHGRTAVAVKLHVARRRHGLQRILHAGIVTPKIAEAAILRVDHHDMTDTCLQRSVECNVSSGLRSSRARVKEIAAA